MSMTYGDLNARDAKEPRPRIAPKAKGIVWDWRSVGAIVGLSGGIVSGLVGCVLTVFAWFAGVGAGGSHVATAGTIFFVLMILLPACGAHCLDLTERHKKAERESRFK